MHRLFGNKMGAFPGLFAWCLLATSSGVGAAGLSIATLPGSPIEDNPVCYDQSSGALGSCDASLFGSKSRIVWVAKDGTGDYVSPLDAVANLNDWCVAPNYLNSCLIRIAPGEYDLGVTPLVLPSSVHLQGSGRTVTYLKGNAIAPNGVVVMGSGIVSDLRITNKANSGTTQAVVVPGYPLSSTGYTRLDRVDIFGGVSATANYGVAVNPSGSVSLKDVDVVMLGGGDKGIRLTTSASHCSQTTDARIRDSSISASSNENAVETATDPGCNKIVQVFIEGSTLAGGIRASGPIQAQIYLKFVSQQNGVIDVAAPSFIDCKAVVSGGSFFAAACTP